MAEQQDDSTTIGGVDASDVTANNISADVIADGDIILNGDKTTIFNTNIPHWTLIAIVAITLSFLVISTIDIEPVKNYVFAMFTPLPFHVATEDESLIVVATFHHTEGTISSEIERKIRRKIKEAAIGFDNLRVEIEPTILRADMRDKAKSLGEKYNASMIIWGEDVELQIIVNFLNLKEPTFDAAKVSVVSKPKQTQIMAKTNPEAYISFITNDVSAQMTFLALFFVGQSYYSQENYDKAIDVIEEAVDSLSVDTTLEGVDDAYFRLGWLYQTTNEPDKAIDAYGKAIVAYTIAIKLKEDYMAYNNRGLAYYNSNKYKEAINDFTKAIELDDKDADAYNNRGLAYYNSNKYKEAINDFNKAIKLDDKDAIAYNNRGNAYKALENYERAIQDYTTAIKLDDKYALAYKNRGRAYYYSDDYDKAIKDFNNAIDLNSKDANAYNWRGFTYKASGDYDKAIQDYSKAIKLDDKDANAYNNRGAAYGKSGDIEQAIRDYEKITELEPDKSTAWNGICWWSSLSGRAKNVVDDACERAVKLAPESDIARNRDSRGLARALTGDYEGAIDDFKAYVVWSKENDLYEKYGIKRERWVAELDAGRNPFDDETLQELRNEE